MVGKTQQTDTLEITLKELMPFADYEIRKFEVQDVSDNDIHSYALILIIGANDIHSMMS